MFLSQFDNGMYVPAQQDTNPIIGDRLTSLALPELPPSDFIQLDDQSVFGRYNFSEVGSETDLADWKSPNFGLEGLENLSTYPLTFAERDHVKPQLRAKQKTSDEESTISSTEATHPPTIWSTRKGSTRPSSIPHDSENQDSATRPIIIVLNYQNPTADNRPESSTDDLQSLASLPDDIGSLAEGLGEMTNIQHTAVTFLVNTLVEDSTLSSLYKEATEKLQEARFIDNHRRLLKQYYLKLKEEGQDSTRLSAVEFLRLRHVRILISQGIWNFITATSTSKRESFNPLLDQNKDDMLMLNRLLVEIGRGAPHPDTSAPQSGSPDASDHGSEDSDVDDKGDTDDVLSHLEATKEFFITGEFFRVYQYSLRLFLQPVTSPITSEDIFPSSDSTFAADKALSAASNQGESSSAFNLNEVPLASSSKPPSPIDKFETPESLKAPESDSSLTHFEASDFSDPDDDHFIGGIPSFLGPDFTGLDLTFASGLIIDEDVKSSDARSVIAQRVSGQHLTKPSAEASQHTREEIGFKRRHSEIADLKEEGSTKEYRVEKEKLEQQSERSSAHADVGEMPYLVHNVKGAAVASSRSLPYLGIVGTFRRFQTFLSLNGLRENGIAPPHQRIRWKNGAGKLLYDDHIEHEEGALQALQHKLTTSAYRSVAGSAGPGGHSSSTSMPTGTTRSGSCSEVGQSNSGDIADRNLASRLNWGARTSRKDLERGRASPNTLHILSCLDARRHSVVLHEELVTDVTDDQQLFRALRNRYYDHRGRPKHHWLLRTVQAIHFVRFAYGSHRHIDIRCHHEICEAGKPYLYLPPIDLVKLNGSEYECTLVPSKLSPPIGPRLLMNFFTNPGA